MLRTAGLKVVEVSGWEKRGSGDWGPDTSNAAYRQPLRGIVCHATAGARGGSTSGEIGVLLNGSPSAPAPIAQLYLARDGTWHVVASGRCNHALVGWAGPLKGWGNYQLVGIEGGNDNRGEPWPKAQLDSYQRGVAALCRKLDLPASRVAGHKEHQPYPPPAGQTSTKSDPVGINMTDFRRRVAALIEEDDMPYKDWPSADRRALATDVVDELFRRPIKRADGTGEISLPSAAEWGRHHAGDAKQDLRARVLPALEAIAATVGGGDMAGVLRAELDRAAAAERAEREQELAPLREAADAASRTLAELAELIAQAQSGALDAQAVVDEIARRLQSGDGS